MDFKDAVEKLKDNPELAKSLEEALRRKAGAEELAAILEGAGLDASVIEALAAEYQSRVGAVLADEYVDEDMLRNVAGGGSGVNCTFEDDCDSSFKDSSNWGYDRCSYNEYCDELVGILY